MSISRSVLRSNLNVITLTAMSSFALIVGCGNEPATMTMSDGMSGTYGVASTSQSSDSSKSETLGAIQKSGMEVAQCRKSPRPDPQSAKPCLKIDAGLVGLDSTSVMLSGNANLKGNAYVGERSSFKGSGNAAIDGALYLGSRAT
ncbi:MAG: hypothetical protein EOP05_20635, partial [Proteobacteria bacterium]